MDFVLRYRGALSGKTNADEKHRIRLRLHPQLKELCAREALFADASQVVLPAGMLGGGRIEPPRNVTGQISSMYFHIPLAGYEFVPLIHRPHKLACALDIIWLRREKPGDIVHGGDLDNRLKNLLDALRMPLEEKEVRGGTPSDTTKRCYCLLEDDALVSKLSVTTHQLLEPLGAGEQTHDVDLFIHVVVQSTYPMIANLGF
jgi:hypothetical protein